MDREKTENYVALGQRLPAPAGGRAAPANSMVPRTSALIPGSDPPIQAMPPADKAARGIGVADVTGGEADFSVPLAASAFVVTFFALTTGHGILEDWQYSLVIASGPMGMFLAMPLKDQAGEGLAQKVRVWLSKIFTLAICGMFFTGGSILVVSIASFLPGSPGWLQHPLPIIAIQYAPALYLWIKRKRSASA